MVETASWAVLDAVTTIGLDTGTLSGLGLEVTTNAPSGRAHSLHPLSVMPPGAPSFEADGPTVLRAAVATDGFHGFESGPLLLSGGFRLSGDGRTFDLSSLVLRPGKKTTTLELVDASGVALLTTADAQWEFDVRTGQFHYLNADLRILPALARRLGDDRYAGVNVGVLDLDATLQVGSLPDAPLPPIGAVPPPGPIAPGVVREVAVSGCSVLATATAVAINVTAVGPSSSGDLAVYAVEPPTASNNIVSFGLGAIRANNAIAPISVDGTLKIKPTLSVSAAMHVLVDVVGYFQ